VNRDGDRILLAAEASTCRDRLTEKAGDVQTPTLKDTHSAFLPYFDCI
jgi:hypothetical protein